MCVSQVFYFSGSALINHPSAPLVEGKEAAMGVFKFVFCEEVDISNCSFILIPKSRKTKMGIHFKKKTVYMCVTSLCIFIGGSL